MPGVVSWHTVCNQGFRGTSYRHIATLGQHPRIDKVCAANGVFTRCLMNMARDAEVRLIGFDKAAHTVTAHMQAGVNAIDRRLMRWTVRHKDFVACLFDRVIASEEVIGNFLLAELDWRIKWCVVRAPNPKNADLTETMPLPVQVDTTLGELM